MEWSQILEWQKNLLFAHKIVFSMEWSLGMAYWSGVEADFGEAKVEWGAVVMCVFGQVLCHFVIVMDQ